MDRYNYIKSKLEHCYNELTKSKNLEMFVMDSCGFVLGEANEYLYSDEIVEMNRYYNGILNNEPIGVIGILVQGTLIEEVIQNLRNHIEILGGITQEQELMLQEAHNIRANVYESVARD